MDNISEMIDFAKQRAKAEKEINEPLLDEFKLIVNSVKLIN